MRHRFPLYAKIVLWFMLNLAVLAVIGLVIVAGRFGPDLLLSGPVTTRIAAVSESLGSEFRAHPPSTWNDLLEGRSKAYGVNFVLFQDDGLQLAGQTTFLPE